jgi:hypothetical protein
MVSNAMVEPAPHAGAQSPRDITGAVHTRRRRLLVVEGRLGWAGGVVVVHRDGGGGRRCRGDVVCEIEAEVGGGEVEQFVKGGRECGPVPSVHVRQRVWDGR